jgi:hypothetical protein
LAGFLFGFGLTATVGGGHAFTGITAQSRTPEPARQPLAEAAAWGRWNLQCLFVSDVG